MRYIILFLLIVLANNSQAQTECISKAIIASNLIDTNYEFSLCMGILDSVNYKIVSPHDSLVCKLSLNETPLIISSIAIASCLYYHFAVFEDKINNNNGNYTYYIDKSQVIRGKKYFPTKNGNNCFDITPYVDSLLPKSARHLSSEGPRYFGIYLYLSGLSRFSHVLLTDPKVESILDTTKYVDNPEFWKRELCLLNYFYKEYYLYNAYLSIHLKSARLNYNEHYLKYIKTDANLKQAYIKLNKICQDYFKYATTYLIPHLEAKINNKTHEQYKFHFSDECLGLKKIFEKPEVQNEIKSFLE